MMFQQSADLGAQPAPADHKPVRLFRPTAAAERDRIRHIVIGSREGVRSVIHQLHVLNYAEPFTWSELIVIPPKGLTLTHEQGEVMSILRRERSRV